MSNAYEGLPEPAALRATVFAEVEGLRVMMRRVLGGDAASNMFDWNGTEYWVDRVRAVVLTRARIEEHGLLRCETLPPAVLEEDELVGGRDDSIQTPDYVDVLARKLVGAPSTWHAARTGRSFINHAVVQPLVNPAFASLFWLAFSYDMRLPLNPADKISYVLGDMEYEMRSYPASRAEAAQVRAAQIEFVRESLRVELDPVPWQAASDTDWAERCAEILHAQTPMLDKRVFHQIRAQMLHLRRERERTGP